MKKCFTCNKELKYWRQTKYCSKQCRNKDYNKKHREYYIQWLAKRYEKVHLKPSINKIQCIICGKWYRQVGSHIYQKHGMTCRQYREDFELEVKRGLLPPDLRKRKAEIVFETGTVKNLKAGEKCWFKKGDPTIGKYKRSPITIERLRNLCKYKYRQRSANLI